MTDDSATGTDDRVVGVLAEAVVRRAGRAHWVAGRADRRWCARLALLALGAVVLVAALGAPPPVVPLVASAAVVPVLVWADVASRAWRLRARHVAEVERIVSSMRAHLDGPAFVRLLADEVPQRGGDVRGMRRTATAAIDEAGCRAGHSPLCRHRRGDHPGTRA